MVKESLLRTTLCNGGAALQQSPGVRPLQVISLIVLG